MGPGSLLTGDAKIRVQCSLLEEFGCEMPLGGAGDDVCSEIVANFNRTDQIYLKARKRLEDHRLNSIEDQLGPLDIRGFKVPRGEELTVGIESRDVGEECVEV